jgi:hypothetical protein
MSTRFSVILVYLLATLLAWLGCFVVVYVFVAVACARGLAAAGALPLIQALCIGTILATAALTVWSVWRARKRLRALESTPGSDPGVAYARFVPFVALAAGVLVLIALAWLALPPLLLPLGC